MSIFTRRMICALLSLLLIMSGQVAASVQDMPMGGGTSAAMAMDDCGHGGADAHSSTAPEAGAQCPDAGAMACLSTAGTGHCVQTLVLAGALPPVYSDSLSHLTWPGRFLSYRGPFLEVITPPPNPFS